MSDTIVLTGKAQTSMWVLLSRRHQIKMHLAGFPLSGLAACLKREFGNHGRYVKDYVVPVEFAISEAGGKVDYNLVNVHIMERQDNGVFYDRGIFASMDEAGTPENIVLFALGRIEAVLTTEDVREPNGKTFLPA